MTLKEFIAKYKGQKIDWDKAYDGQCVDLFRQYNHEVLGINQPKGVVGAADFWSAYDSDSVLNTNFDKIPNSDTFIPKEGDVALWNKKMGGGFGHVGVCTGKGDLNTFESFDQNWSKISYCELVTHTYSSFYGVLRPKVKEVISVSQCEADLAEQRKQVELLQGQVNGLLVDIKKKDNLNVEITGQLTEANANAKGFRSERDYLLSESAKRLGTRQEAVEILASIDGLLVYEEKADALDRKLAIEVKEHIADVNSFGKQIESLKTQLASLEIKYKELKDTQITPTQPTPKYSILEYILKLIRR